MTTTMRTLALAGSILAAAAIISRAPAQSGDAAQLAARVQVLEDREAIRALIMGLRRRS